jgi:YbbR domain-containing protein
MNLITQEWRLKLLALGLAILMLGAVAFSQSNTRTLQVPISYVNRPNGLILISPLDRIAVSISAPNDLPLTAASVTATADLSHIKKGPGSVPIQVRTTDPTRIVVQSPPPITVNADTYLFGPSALALPVQVRTPNVQTGWSVTKAFAQCPSPGPITPCVVTFTGPASVANGLDAFVTVNAPISGQKTETPSLPVQFEQNGRPIDLTKLETLPLTIFQPSTVTAEVDTTQGTTSIQVTLLDAAPTHYPPSGYRVTNVVVSPLTVLCTGSGPAVGSLTRITLPGVDLSHSTSNVTFKVQVPVPAAGVVCSPSVASVTYTIAPNPSAQPSPTPTPT